MSDHPHDHHSDHDPHAPVEEVEGPPSEHVLLEIALRELLIEKGLFAAADVTRQIEKMDATTPEQGARLVAKFWTDPAYRQRALADGKAAAAELGIDMSVAPKLVILENTARLHHVVVCTLCSCYPRAVLGLPPAWYKSPAYRARTVKDSRGVLAEFGTSLPDDVEIRVVDSTADCRYLVVPVRPHGSEGMDEAALAGLVTRDTMIGVALAREP